MFGRNPVRVLIVIFPAVLPAWLMIGVWFILQLVNVLGTTGQAVQSGGVAYAAHVGGFISGMILCLPFRPARRPPPRWRRW
jgi:membrane associated rhomboid family serine protease